MAGTLTLKNIIEDMEVLRRKCTPVDSLDNGLLEELDAMLAMMYEAGGIGLAANQAGLTRRMIVIDLQRDGQKDPIFLLNPEILEKSGETKLGPEGCLSVPVTEKSDVRRSTWVKVRSRDRNGEEVILDASGLLAVCLQHEIDHLDGILYIDHLSRLRRNFLVEKAESNLRRLGRVKRGG